MNILITGAAGFIGQNLAEHFAKETGDLLFCLRHDRPVVEIYGNILIGDVCDLRRMQEIIVYHEIDQIYHLAAKSIVRDCIADPIGCFRANVLGTVTVLEAARLSGRIRGVLCAESDKSYGPGPVPYREDQALVPKAIYEASKACVAHVASAYWHNYGVPVVTVRTANVYGERDPNRTRLVPNTILQLLDGKPPQITAGAADFRREFVYVGDVCEAYRRVLESGRWGEAFNVGSGECLTVREAIGAIGRAMDSEQKPEDWAKPTALVEIADQYLDLTKLRTVWTDYAPRRMADVLPQIIDWYGRHRR